MQLRSLLLLFILAMPVYTFAQDGRPDYDRDRHNDRDASSLSVFSEDGEQFFLVLNGVNQNNVPTSRIRVEGLPKYDNDVEIIFADRRTQAIRKRVNIADPVDGRSVDMVLKLQRSRDGYLRLKFHRCTEVEHDYRPQRDEYVMDYGRPGEPNRVNTTTTTTTTTYNNTPQQVVPQQPTAMDPATFAAAKSSIESASFESTKYSTAQTILAGNYVNTNQVIELCNLFSFDNTKLAFAKFAYDKTLDKNNYFKVANVLSFDANKKALNDYISHH